MEKQQHAKRQHVIQDRKAVVREGGGRWVGETKKGEKIGLPGGRKGRGDAVAVAVDASIDYAKLNRHSTVGTSYRKKEGIK